MARIVVYDAGPLGLLTRAPGSPRHDACRAWHDHLWTSGVLIGIPEIAAYEVRRELLRIGATSSLGRLRDLSRGGLFLPITTAAMERAAELWALARASGRQGASDESLDADCILAAQVERAVGKTDRAIIATDNMKHFRVFPGIEARPWQQINPESGS